MPAFVELERQYPDKEIACACRHPGRSYICKLIEPLIQKIITAVVFVILLGNIAFCQQMRLSLASDAGLQRSLKKDQRYWAAGQTIGAQLSISPKNGAYLAFVYYSKGNVNNEVEATAKSPVTQPAVIAYTSKGVIKNRQISIGWKHYFKGDFASEDKWSLYGTAGFGLVFGTAQSTSSVAVDTALYEMPVLSGKGHFKRLTYDLALGFEKPLGGDIFLYSEIKTAIPSTDYPSKYLYVNEGAPLTACACIGLRVLF